MSERNVWLMVRRPAVLAVCFIASSALAVDLTISGSGNTENFSSGTTNYGSISIGETSDSSSNTVNILGATTVVNAATNVLVGNNGPSNALMISSGGLLADSIGYLGVATTSANNTVTVTGSNSTWSNEGIYVGYAGSHNSLTIAAGGTVTGTNGNTALGQFASSGNNQASVTGTNSLWDVSGALITGYSGSTNTVVVSNGGRIQVAANNLIGFLSGAIGNSVLVTGSNSTMTTAGTTFAGYQGSGTLTVEDSAQVSGNFVVGYETGSSGTITVNGTSGSRGILSAGTVTRGNGTGAFVLDGGILQATGNSTAFVAGFGSGNFTLGSRDGYVDSNGKNVTIGNVISGAGGLIKQGAGTLTLGTAGSPLTQAYTGPTTVSGGTLIINGTSNVPTTVQSGAILGGNATVGNLTITGGTLSPGNSPGIINSDSLSLDSISTLHVELSGNTGSPVAGTNYDQTNVSGSVSLGSASLTLVELGDYAFVENSLFFIVGNDGSDSVLGTFAGLGQNSVFYVGGHAYQISYAGNLATLSFSGGNDVVLMAIPEPSTCLLLVSAAGLLFSFRAKSPRRTPLE